jgi:two-component system CheB/CheR fusion protein
VTGARVIQAASGFEAVDYWRREPFDILICDLAMPGMDGYEVLRSIRDTPSANGHRSVAIALTALASDSERRAVLAAGFDDHLVKPFNFADLLRAVSRPA